jgi:outer membrane protein OmpA-like peptidoglycan-associated protein
MNIRLSTLFVFFSLGLFAQEQVSFFFDSDRWALSPAQQKILIDWMAGNPEVKIVGIHGFTDEDGTTGYNDTLARKRVDHIFQAIKGKMKIREDFKTRSFGEKHRLSKIKAENRKVTLFYLLPKDLPRENEILGIKPETVPAPRQPRNFPDKITVDNPNGTKSEFKLDRAFMKQVDQARPGEKLTLQNLNFRINTFAIMPESRGKLYELLLVMQQNPSLKIDIQGHLCCQPVDRLDLSTQRAKAVVGFLTANGIERSRLSYKGFGSTQPIYPLPERTDEERAANRRVEVFVVAND